jgi:hypothetical protein
MILISFLFHLMKYHFMYICNTEVYGSKELFQTGKIDDPLYGKISLTYRFSIMDEFLLLLFPCLISGPRHQRKPGVVHCMLERTTKRFVGDPRRSLIS